MSNRDRKFKSGLSTKEMERLYNPEKLKADIDETEDHLGWLKDLWLRWFGEPYESSGSRPTNSK